MSEHGRLVQFVLGRLRVKTNLCTRQVHEHGYTLDRRIVADYNLIFVTRGRPVWVIEEADGPREYDLEPGTMVIVPPGAWHHAFHRSQRITIGSIHVDAALPDGQDVFDLLRPPRIMRFRDGTPLDRYLRGALAEFDRPSFQDAQRMLASWGRLVVLELLRQADQHGELNPRPIDPIVARMLDHLTDLRGAVTLDDLAAHAGYTPQHLNRLFRKELGVTPLQYLARLRMDEAAALLVESPLTVRAVGEALGYEDPYYFSRTFKQHFGRSPAQYRAGALPGA